MPRNNYVAIDKMSAPRLASFADANAFARPFCLVKWLCGMKSIWSWLMLMALLGVQNDF